MTTQLIIVSKTWVPDIVYEPSEDHPDGFTIKQSYWDMEIMIQGAVCYQGRQNAESDLGEMASSEHLVEYVRNAWNSSDDWELVQEFDPIE